MRCKVIHELCTHWNETYLLKAAERDGHSLDEFVEPLQLLEQYDRGRCHHLPQVLTNHVQLEPLW